MNVNEYRQLRYEPLRLANQSRRICLTCRKPLVTCYCSRIRSFDSKPRFVILIDPLEANRSIATGRMAHQCLSNSLMIEGVDFSANDQVNGIINDRHCYSVLLYPKASAINLSDITRGRQLTVFPSNRELVIFVIDSTWRTARKIIKRSENLQRLPAVCFTPLKPSNFRIRKQPDLKYYSTIEAIHYVLDILGEYDHGTDSRPHDNLMEVVNFMINQQLKYMAKNNKERIISTLSYRCAYPHDKV